MKTFKKAFYFPLLFLFLLFNISNFANAANIPYAGVKIDANSTVDAVTINGAILTIGNQLLCKTTADFAACEDPGTTGNTQNNHHTQWRTRIDSNVTHSNSMARLVLEPGDTIKFARLYWSARAVGGSGVGGVDSAAAREIKIKGPASTVYTQLTSPASKHGSSGQDYGASADVTQYVIDNGEGDYYAGDILSQTNNTGIYASWQLVVVVENSARSLKNLAIYDGYDSIYGADAANPDVIIVDATGFITPTGTDPFDANLFVYGGETDDGYADSTWIKDGSGNWIALTDGQGDTNDVMNASVSSPDYPGGYRDGNASLAEPNYRNVLGVDIDKLQINDKLDTSKQILSNSQLSTQIKLQSTGDRYSLIMFAFETEVFVPEFCYDYAYKQQGKYFTEENDGSQAPRLTGDVISGEPIEMTIFLKSKVDGTIQIQNMEIHVSDINTTQADYIPNTADANLTNATKVAKIGELYPHKVNVNAGVNYIHDIPIGTLNQNEYFYLYYSLDPHQDEMNMPINVQATYNLQLSGLGTPVPYTLTLSEEIPLCSTNNFEYTPAKGIFNIAHNDYYFYDLNPAGAKLYNLPTQVIKREGNFKVLAMDENDFDELNFDHKPTVVAVEMIDAGAFHYTDASCKEMESSISERVWIRLDENITSVPLTQAALQSAIIRGMTDISISTDFYAKATQNTAFRITYNSTDVNGSIVQLETIGDRTNVTNFSSFAGMDCVQDVDGNPANTDTVAQFCSNSGSPYVSAMTDAQLKVCMECVYGIDTRFICSRDNFAIRPEAFMLKLNDLDQTNPAVAVRFRDDVSGVTAPNTSQVELAAGYQYNLEVAATSHLDNNLSLGYTRTFGVGSNDIIGYQWSTSAALTGCNDETNSTISFKIVDGAIDLNTSLDQVGVYRLHMEDESWTDVDHNPAFMLHHNGGAPFFNLPATADCIVNSSTTQVVNSGNRNGCNISSNHSASATTLEYRDYDVEFHPYKFEMSTIMPQVGINHLDVNDTIITTSPTGIAYVYMTDMSFDGATGTELDRDQNMSYHLNGNIAAVGYNDVQLTNFVRECYARPLDLNVSKSNTTLLDINNNSILFQAYLHNRDENGITIIADDIKVDMNETNSSANPITIQTGQNYFTKGLNGSMSTILNINYNRNIAIAANPKSVSFSSYDVKCTNDSNCTFNADMSAVKTTEGKAENLIPADNTIRFYYGRTHAPRYRFVGPAGDAFIYYEVYCEGAGCNKALLQNGAGSTYTDDPRWFKNSIHSVATFGSANTVTQKGANLVVPSTLAPYDNAITGQTRVPIFYNATTRGYPYKATMENNASGWLIYNKYNGNAATVLTNEFEVEFVSGNSGWAGEKDDGTNTTTTTGSAKTNRRSMW